MNVLVEPSYFLADPQVRPFIRDMRQDVTATNAPTVAVGKYVVFTVRPPRGQVLIVKSFVPYAMARTDVGLATESFALIDPLAAPGASGVFSFEPTVNDSAPFVIESDFNAPQLAGTGNDLERVRNRGVSYISADPWQEAQQSWFNPLFSILVPGDSTFQVIFSILPPAPTNPLPIAGQYTVGGAGGGKRVDFAGCVVVGQQMTEQYYHSLEKSFGIIRPNGKV